MRLVKLNPVDQFASTLRYGRSPLEDCYKAAWTAAVRNGTLTDDLIQSSLEHSAFENVFEPWRSQENESSAKTEEVASNAYGEATRADVYASIVLIVLDNALRQLGLALQIPKDRAKDGFGKTVNGVPLTRLLREAANCIRHAIEWDENRYLGIPYDNDSLQAAIEEVTRKHGEAYIKSDSQVYLISSARHALRTIRVLQDAFGLGRHDRIYMAPAWSFLVTIDGKFLAGKLGSSEPDFSRIDGSVVAAGREMVEHADPATLPAFDARFAPRPDL